MRLGALGDVVGRLAISLGLGSGGTERLGLLESLGRRRSELLRWEHRRAQPIACLGERGAADGKLGTVLGERGALVLVLGHEHVSDAMLRGNIVMELLVKHDRCRVQVRVEALVLRGQVIVLLFVHFFIDDILLRYTQCTTSTLLVDLGSSTGRLNASLETAITAARGRNISTALSISMGAEDEAKTNKRAGAGMTNRSWFSSWVRSVLTGLAAVNVRRSAGMVRSRNRRWATMVVVCGWRQWGG